jgi:acid phosphatase
MAAASSASSRGFLLHFMGILLLAISAMICLLTAVLFLLGPTQSQSLSLHSQQQQLGYLQTHHQGWWGGGHDDCHRNKDRWDILYHLGGNGPWIEKVDGVAKGGIAVPEGCEVDMVHMVRTRNHLSSKLPF